VFFKLSLQVKLLATILASMGPGHPHVDYTSAGSPVGSSA
jgi:hypothetical protein